MSRSIQRSKCHSSCDMCKPHKVTGERPISERCALTVEGDLAAIDHLHWMVAQDIGGWSDGADAFGDGSYHVSCDDCGMCLDCGDCDCRQIFVTPSPLRVPLADLARCA